MSEQFRGPDKRIRLAPPPVPPAKYQEEEIPDSSDFDYNLKRGPEIPGEDPDFDMLFDINEAIRINLIGGEGTVRGDLDIALRDPSLSARARLALKNAEQRIMTVNAAIDRALRTRLAPSNEWEWRRQHERVHRERSRRMMKNEK